ncbi:hypothetical protein ACFO3J_21545 [Streptomyces polygonati]|uniref:Subtilisin inhibitor domain-containing protein n=1 Tax=Streptomyces polygonati TaxID=1617087 RepID=A0ABV8HQ43_9ACTN
MSSTRTARPTPRRTPHRAPLGSVVLRVLGILGAALMLAATPGAAAQAVGLPWSAPGGHLVITYDDGSGHSRTYHVVCGGRTSWTQACRRLREIGGPVGPVAGGELCSMIYGGPQSAEVRGRWAGQVVAESYRRTNGCEVARWSRMVPVLPAPGQESPHRELKG